jgi:hypothetical protein
LEKRKCERERAKRSTQKPKAITAIAVRGQAEKSPFIGGAIAEAFYHYFLAQIAMLDL